MSHQHCCATSADLYHCIAGHEEVAEFLLQCGAVCNPYTFDGDRCHCELLYWGQLQRYRLPLLGGGVTLRGTCSFGSRDPACLVQVVPAAESMPEVDSAVRHMQLWEP